jgi:type II secretory pathway pseudopilin PulG
MAGGRGSTLAEIIVAIGLLSVLLLVVALLSTITVRQGRSQRRLYLAQQRAEDVLDHHRSTALSDKPPGVIPILPGAFPDETPYQIDSEVYAPPADLAGVDSQQLRRLVVRLHWREAGRRAQVVAETYLVKLPR